MDIYNTNNYFKILVTGTVGLIGFHLSSLLLDKCYQVIGIDNMNDYYAVSLKEGRLTELKMSDSFTFYKMDLKNKEAIDNLFNTYRLDYVINLAARTGIIYSITKPYAYVDSNLIGFVNILETCRNHTVSLYAETKKTNKLMAYIYSYIYKILTTGLRFFTVYSP